MDSSSSGKLKLTVTQDPRMDLSKAAADQMATKMAKELDRQILNELMGIIVTAEWEDDEHHHDGIYRIKEITSAPGGCIIWTAYGEIIVQGGQNGVAFLLQTDFSFLKIKHHNGEAEIFRASPPEIIEFLIEEAEACT